MSRYEYPPVDQIDPFDMHRGEPQFIVFGSNRVSYATTERPDRLGLALEEWIPMGYNVLAFAQKAAVYRNRRLERSWPLVVSEPDPPEEDSEPWRLAGYRWQHASCGYRISVAGDEVGHRLEDGAYDPVAAAETAAKSSVAGRSALWFVYEVANWH
ncbi:hypothetical protein [Glycomyces algeriensis]|uniref:Uncharacterized protein n=1 Tax=Glycomyces algeriensis TaxID=256037 RepID=A0A9W6GAW3_9ACTN|nr:hypothetical protein [Glycomyces algeriensis]MDA1364668.1 hypothetical protein [Glycomyces algeriensis]MDR7350708.1 hypothetical protein [Glycomyces algeriensis]GLI43419.1 hypothetical protein GALLR39Z86_32690 [Glycomyces algeriensis]